MANDILAPSLWSDDDLSAFKLPTEFPTLSERRPGCLHNRDINLIIQSESRLFRRLPPEVRRHIYLCAFGDRRLHIALTKRLDWVRGTDHGGMNMSNLLDTSNNNLAWRWWSASCHDIEPDMERLSVDWCHLGYGHCRQSAWKLDCQVGVLGWLTSCRQAYQETLEIVYGSNTFFIRSLPLSYHLTHAIPSQNLSFITSLNFAWRPVMPVSRYSISETHWQSTTHAMSLITPALFPRLRSLIIMVEAGISFRYASRTADSGSDYDGGHEILQKLVFQPCDRLSRGFATKLDRLVYGIPDEVYDLSRRLLPDIPEHDVPYADEYAKCRQWWRDVATESVNETEETLDNLQLGALSGKFQLGYWVRLNPRRTGRQKPPEMPRLVPRVHTFIVNVSPTRTIPLEDSNVTPGTTTSTD